MKIVISQPMFMCWIGMFEQVRLADVFVHYDDVQFSKGGFISRVQIRTDQGVKWLTAPLDRKKSGRLINECEYKANGWRDEHLNKLLISYRDAPYLSNMMMIAESVYGFEGNNVAAFNRNALEYISTKLGISSRFLMSSELGIGGRSSRRVVDICSHLAANEYITGLGELDYLDESLFSERGIDVRYMDYRRMPYPQVHGEFTPYVSVLDAFANLGPEAGSLLMSQAVPRDEIAPVVSAQATGSG